MLLRRLAMAANKSGTMIAILAATIPATTMIVPRMSQRGVFSSTAEQAAMKCLYLVTRSLNPSVRAGHDE